MTWRIEHTDGQTKVFHNGEDISGEVSSVRFEHETGHMPVAWVSIFLGFEGNKIRWEMRKVKEESGEVGD